MLIILKSQVFILTRENVEFNKLVLTSNRKVNSNHDDEISSWSQLRDESWKCNLIWVIAHEFEPWGVSLKICVHKMILNIIWSSETCVRRSIDIFWHIIMGLDNNEASILILPIYTYYISYTLQSAKLKSN